MRFLAVAVACLAITAKVSAQLQDVSDSSEYSLMDSDSDFDISGKMLPVQQQQEAPLQHQPIKEHKKMSALPVQQQPIKEEIKMNTVLLQPIVLMPKRKEVKHVFIKSAVRKAPQQRKSLNLDIDRTLSYKVSPSIHAANSRSVDVEFTPIFNARMKNVALSQQDYQPTSAPTSMPVLLPIQQESMPMKGGRISTRFTSEMPVFSGEQQYSGLRSSSWEQPQEAATLSSGQQWRVNPYLAAVHGIQGIQGLQQADDSDRFQGLGAADFDSDFIHARSGLGSDRSGSRQIPDLDYTSIRINQPDESSLSSGSYLLSSFDATLPNVPASSRNLVKLGVSQPLKFKLVLNACVQQNIDSIACKQVFKAAKMLVKSPVASDIFAVRSNIQQ